MASRALPQRVLLTGASRGIGLAIASALDARGARLALVGRDETALQRIRGVGPRHVAIVADLAVPGAAERCVSSAVDGLGGLDAFVSCAGVVHYAAVTETDRSLLGSQLDVNLIAPFLIARHAVEPLRAAGRGAMVFVASTLALASAPLTAGYAASKAALVSASRSLALELAPLGIRVNAVAPGVVETDMIRVQRPSATRQAAMSSEHAIAAQLEALRRLHPLGRLGRPEDVAETVLYLLSAPFVTGTTVPVDGGLLLGVGET